MKWFVSEILHNAWSCTLDTLKNTSQVGSETIVNFIYNLSNIASAKSASLQQPYHKQEVMNGVKTM